MSDQEPKAPCNGVVILLPNGRFADQDAHAFTDWAQDPEEPSWQYRRCTVCYAGQRRQIHGPGVRLREPQR